MIPSLIYGAKFRVKDLSLGDLHTALISNSGSLHTFGDNRCGQLGLGKTT